MENKLTVADLDKLLELFQEFKNLLKPELPPRDGQLWAKAMEQSRKELADKLRERQAGFTFRPGQNRHVITKDRTERIEAKRRKDEKRAAEIINQEAEKKYRLWDSEYNQSLSKIDEKVADVVKRIDHTLYSLKEPLLLEFDRTKGTLLQADLREIREHVTVNQMRQFPDLVERTIDSLEAIKLKVGRQQQLEVPIKHTNINFVIIVISIFIIGIFEFLIYQIPISWLQNHPNSYGLQGGFVLLVPCFVAGCFKPRWRKYCWGGAALAIIVLILSLLGGPNENG